MSCYRIEKIGSLQDFAVKKISRHRSITADDVGNVRMEYQEFLEAKEKKNILAAHTQLILNCVIRFHRLFRFLIIR